MKGESSILLIPKALKLQFYGYFIQATNVLDLKRWKLCEVACA